MKTKAGMKIEMETAKLEQNMQRLEDLTGKSLEEIVKDVSIAVIQSAGKAAPPSRMKKRPVVKFGSGSRARFMVPWRRKSGAGKWWFGDRSEANKHATITYRGITKAGWLFNLPTFGKPANMANKPALSTLADKISSAVFHRGRSPWSEIANRVQNIASYAEHTLAQGMGAANVRLTWQIRNLAARMARQWARG